MRLALIACPLVLLSLPGLILPGNAQEIQRGVARPRTAQASSPNGSYYALVIGINAYQHENALQTAVGDAQALDAVLRERYGFRTRLLLNAQATRANILNAFAEYRRTLQDNDSLLIYYAGHGTRDGDKAYWLPVDADPDSTANWIIADDLTTGVRVIPARHVLIISDSCYSGGISRDANVNTLPADHNAAIAKMLANRSRVLISSGRDEPVADGGGSGHSIFSAALLNGLTKIDDEAFSALNLFDRYVRESVIGASAQVPLYQMIQNSGHDGGDFVFFPKAAASISRSIGPDRPPVPNRQGGTGTVPAAPMTTSPKRPPSPTAKARGPVWPDDFPKPPPADASGALQLTRFRTALLMLRDAPQSLTDEALLPFAKQQVSIEQSMWNFIDSATSGKDSAKVQLNPKKPAFVYEWQNVLQQNPALARGALMDLFLRSDADWTFTERDKDWDDTFDIIEDAFVLSKDQVLTKEGKPTDNEFTARRVMPVLRQHLQMAAAKAPVKLWFTVMLPGADYDFNTSAMRFRKQSNAGFDPFIEILDPQASMLFAKPAPEEKKQGWVLPAEAQSMMNYRTWSEGRSIFPSSEDLIKPGVIFKSVENQAILSPTEGWREGFTWMARYFPVEPMGLSLDRQLRIGPIPMDATAAEAAHPMMNNLRAQVFITVTGMKTVEWVGPGNNVPSSLLFAKVEKIKIFDRKGAVIATVDAKTLPPAK